MNQFKKNATIEIILIGLPKKVTKLENNHHEHLNASPMANGDAFSSEDFSKWCNTLESEMLVMRTSKGTRVIMFQELVIRILG